MHSQTEYMDFDGREFWIRFDVLLQKKGANIRELCASTGLMYSTINTQRTRHTIPKAEYLYEIACFLSVSMEELLTGKDSTSSIQNSEAKAVEESPELQALVRAIIRDPNLLRIISAVVESSEKYIGAAT